MPRCCAEQEILLLPDIRLAADTKTDSSASSSKADWKASKEALAQERKRKNELKRVESSIEELEKREKEIDILLEDPKIATNMSELMKLHTEKEDIKSKLDTLYEKWEELADDN